MPETSILRPLGEEHLRMFKRTMGGTPRDESKVSLPEESIFGRITIPSEPVRKEDARKAAEAHGGRLATVLEVLMEHELFEKFEKRGPFYFDPKDAPKGNDHYRINRATGSFEKMSEEELQKFPWHERLLNFSISALTGQAAAEGELFTLSLELDANTDEKKGLMLTEAPLEISRYAMVKDKDR